MSAADPQAPDPGGSALERKAREKERAFRNHMLRLNLLSALVGLGIWWLLSEMKLAGLPGPLSVARRGGELLQNGTLVNDMLASVRRVLIGFAIGTALAVPIGFLMGWYSWARGTIEPYVQFFRTIPPLAMIPLAIVFLGIGEVPKVFVITLAAFLVSVIATFQGVVNVDRILIDAARVLGAGDGQVFRKVVIPASTPFIFVGMRTGLGAAWSTLVAAELIAAQEGLGHRMQQAQIYYDLETIFVALVAIGLMGLVMDRILLWLDARLTGWQERR